MPEAQQPAPQPQVATPQQKHNWKKVWLTILLIVGVVVVISGIYWFFILGKTSEDSDLTGPVPKVTTPKATESAKEATPSAEKDETADWKTFKNESYSFKYPSTWEQTIAPNSNVVVSSDTEGTFNIGFYANQDYSEFISTFTQVIKKEEFTVDAHKATKIFINNPTKQVAIIIDDAQMGGKDGLLQLNATTQNLTTVEKILSTFKFLK
jgi:cytoskeletal protein RodZ